jgi:hypothetical protein
VSNPLPDGNVWSTPPAPGQPGTPYGTPYGSPYGTPFGMPSPPAREPRDSLASTGDVLAAVVAAAAMLVAGVPMGLLWGATAPRVDLADLLANSSETALEAQPAADARFALLAIVFGLVAGAIAAWRGRKAGWPLPVGLLLGGLGGSLIAAQVGHLLASGKALRPIPPTASPLVRDLVDVTVRADGVHVLYPFVALLVFMIVVTVTTRAEPLRVPEGPPAGAWWSGPR